MKNANKMYKKNLFKTVRKIINPAEIIIPDFQNGYQGLD